MSMIRIDSAGLGNWIMGSVDATAKWLEHKGSEEEEWHSTSVISLLAQNFANKEE